MAALKLSFGKFDVAEPTLLGWERVLKTLSEEDFPVLARAIGLARDATGDAVETDKILAAVGEALLPLTVRVPRMALTFLEVCLRIKDEELNEGGAKAATATDLVVFIAFLVDKGVLAQLVETAKNRLSPLLAKAAAEDRASEQG